MAQVKDPVCGMMVNPDTAAATSERDGTKFYFCSVACQRKFEVSRRR